MAKKKTYTSRQAAEKLGISYSSLRTKMSRNKITPPNILAGSWNLVWFMDDIRLARKQLTGK